MRFMQAKTVKTYIKQLVKRFGSKEKTAQRLGVSLRYIYMLEKGEKIPSEHLRKLIKVKLNEDKRIH